MNRCIVVVVGLIVASAAMAQEKWEVHDRKRPQPVVVTPPTASTQEQPGTAPSDAIVLFDGKDLSQWQGTDGGEAKWKVENGTIEIAKGTGNIGTKKEFGDMQLHIEWMIPEGTEGKDQHSGNSGVFLIGQYEVHVLDNYKSETYADGT